MKKIIKDMKLSAPKETALNACEYFMRPIARLLLKMGVGFKEFAEAAKVAFVDVASEDSGIRGRPTNISRVAVMTGLTRKEVRKLRDLIAADEISDAFRSRLGPCSVIMHFWYHDPNYADESGVPRVLPIEGSEPSFASLVRKYGGDIPTGAMLRELLRTGVIERCDEFTVRAIKEFVIPKGVSPDKFVSVSFSLSNLAQTLANNVTESRDDAPLFERFVWTDRLDAEQRAEFQAMAGAKAKEFLKELNRWVAEREGEEHITTIDRGNAAPRRVGLGVYIFDNDADKRLFY